MVAVASGLLLGDLGSSCFGCRQWDRGASSCKAPWGLRQAPRPPSNLLARLPLPCLRASLGLGRPRGFHPHLCPGNGRGHTCEASQLPKGGTLTSLPTSRERETGT